MYNIRDLSYFQSFDTIFLQSLTDESSLNKQAQVIVLVEMSVVFEPSFITLQQLFFVLNRIM